MHIQRLVGLLILLACCGYGLVQAQPGQSATSKNSSQVPANRPYLLGPGDVLEVNIFDTTFTTRNVQVDGDGYISSLPFIEPVIAKCRTERQVQADLTAAYARLIKDPQVSVLIRERNSRTPASIYGAVRQATKVPTLRPVRLNELIAAAGGFSEKAAGTIQILHTEPVMCPEPGEEEQARPINGTAVPLQVVAIADLHKGAANPMIRPGDLVLVTEAEPVYIMGSVTAPGSIMMRDQLTLSRALATVGGPRKDAKISEIKIYRQKAAGSTEQEIIKVDYAAIKKNQISDVYLKAYDVIDVSDNGVFGGLNWWETLAKIFLNGAQNTLVRPIP